MGNSKIGELVKNLQNSMRGDFAQYEPYIRYIRFPYFKAVEENTKISFDFPLTILVGANGTNKTSILQAIYGCPDGYSVGDFWFSTKVDEIKDSKQHKHCVVHAYKHSGANCTVEVLKTRVGLSRKIKKEEKTVKDTDDYWEPSRPIKRYDMVIPSKKELRNAKNKATTRWDLIKKSVSYEDCKEYMSAYDVLFYHTYFRPTKTLKTRQEFIRFRSKYLSEFINMNLSSYEYRKRERIDEIKILDSNTKDSIGYILGRKYLEIKVINHSFYTQKPGKTVYIKQSDLTYSEAFAGTGEARAILLVDRIMSAPNKSLILIDEPEISLHPLAIERFMEFLLQQILVKKHQVIISTHSPSVINGFPQSAIKLLTLTNSNKVRIISDVPCELAFKEIGHRLNDKKRIYVEDDLLEYVVKFYFEKKYNNNDVIDITYLGGADTIITKFIPISAIKNKEHDYYLLDGDKNRSPYDCQIIKNIWLNENGKVDEKRIPVSENDKLSDIIREITGSEIKFFIDTSNIVELVKTQRSFIEYWAKNVWFFCGTIPENEICGKIDIDGKEFYKKKAVESYGTENLTSKEILSIIRLDFPKKITHGSKIYKHLEQVFSHII